MMRSSIKIDVDRYNTPILKVELDSSSTDLRDKMMCRFFDDANTFDMCSGITGSESGYKTFDLMARKHSDMKTVAEPILETFIFIPMHKHLKRFVIKSTDVITAANLINKKGFKIDMNKYEVKVMSVGEEVIQL